jgi:Bacterial regulatory proteins, lacI family
VSWLRYVFRGYGPVRGAIGPVGPKLVDVARRAGVSTGTVSAVLNRPAVVLDATRMAVERAIADLGYVRGGPVAVPDRLLVARSQEAGE